MSTTGSAVSTRESEPVGTPRKTDPGLWIGLAMVAMIGVGVAATLAIGRVMKRPTVASTSTRAESIRQESMSASNLGSTR